MLIGALIGLAAILVVAVVATAIVQSNQKISRLPDHRAQNEYQIQNTSETNSHDNNLYYEDIEISQ